MDSHTSEETMTLTIISIILLSAKLYAILRVSSRVLSLVGTAKGGPHNVAGDTRYLRVGLALLWWLWIAVQLHLLILLYVLKTVVGIGNTYLSRELEILQLALFRKLPSRVLSRIWGRLVQVRLPNKCLRLAALKTYVWLFGCKLEEAVEEDIRTYPSLLQFFTRTLKDGVRPISPDHPVVSPADGKVLHFGKVENRQVEQVKGVTYKLNELLGPGSFDEGGQGADNRSRFRSSDVPVIAPAKGNEMFHAIIYLGPGDYHHFHSPTDWNAQMRRHIVGELLTVAPWAARLCPGLFILNERVVLSGYWEYGYFSMTAVGAYNVGSIEVDLDKDLKTNLEKDERNGQGNQGEFADKVLGESSEGVAIRKGSHVGHFNLGSSIVLVFEAPKEFRFVVEPGDTVQYGQALGRVAGQAHMESDLE